MAKEELYQKIRRGYYIFADIEKNEQVLFLMANNIYAPSYISLETAFSFYNFIPEGVYAITSITSHKTLKIENENQNFLYKHLNPNLFFGYELREYKNYKYRIAEPEKAILDYFYLNPKIKGVEDFEGLRLNVFEMQSLLDKKKLEKYLVMFGNKSFSKRVHNFLSYLEYA